MSHTAGAGAGGGGEGGGVLWGCIDNGIPMLNWINMGFLIGRISLISLGRWKHDVSIPQHCFTTNTQKTSSQTHTNGQNTQSCFHECGKNQTNLFLFLFVVNLQGQLMKTWRKKKKKQNSVSFLWKHNKANIQILTNRHHLCRNGSARYSFPNTLERNATTDELLLSSASVLLRNSFAVAVTVNTF